MRSLADCRQDFPSLTREFNGRPLVYLDGPAGSQVPRQVIDTISGYYQTSNANTHGQFVTTWETDEMMDAVRVKTANFLGAEGPGTISFGQNMTTLCYSLSRAIGRTLKPGDEIVITELDHEANRGPWLALEEFGAVIREVKLMAPGVLDYDDFKQKITEKTRLVAVGFASNLTGTINDLSLVREWSKAAGALMVVDGVHYAPHYSIDVREIDCDFFFCSAYKFYGPHIGLLYSKPGLLEQIPTDRLVTQDQEAPYLIETGTLNHAAIAGVGAAIDYLESFGDGAHQRQRLEEAFSKISRHEHTLGKRLYEGISSLSHAQITGLDFSLPNRTPTVSFYRDGYSAEEICRKLGEKSVLAWDGHFYALKAVQALGYLEKGGVTRLGISLYSTEEEIDYTLEVLRGLG